MIGNRVEITLRHPSQRLSGELRKQTVEGVWIYSGWAEKAAVRFYPQHRIVEITDLGYVPR